MIRLRTPFLLLLLFMSCGFAATSARAASLTYAPAETTVTVGDDFTLRVVLDAVPDFKGCDLVYGYTSRVSFVQAAAGDVVTSGGAGFFEFVLPDVVPPADSIWYDAARLTGIGTGPGVVVFFTLHAVSEGDATLTCLSADVRDSNNQPLAPSCSGALVHIIGPTPTRAFSWGRVKAIYR